MILTEGQNEKQNKSVIGQGSRLCIGGLNAAATATVRQVLIELGAVATSFRPGADGIVLPDNASGADRAEALAQGFAVFTVSELTRFARGAAPAIRAAPGAVAAQARSASARPPKPQQVCRSHVRRGSEVVYRMGSILRNTGFGTSAYISCRNSFDS